MINVSEMFNVTHGKQIAQEYFDTLYAPFAIKPTLVYLPTQRGLSMVDSGKLDAEGVRFLQVASPYPNLIRITEPVMEVTVNYYCLTSVACTFSDKSVMLVPEGFASAKQLCQQRHLTCMMVSSDINAITSLKKHAGDAYLGHDSGLISAACQAGITHLYTRPEPLLSQYTYHYLSKKHWQLALPLAERINALKQNQESYLGYLLKKYRECDIQIDVL